MAIKNKTNFSNAFELSPNIDFKAAETRGILGFEVHTKTKKKEV